MILSTGVIGVIARAFPSIKVDVLAAPMSAPVVSQEPWVNDVVVFDRKSPLSWPVALAGVRSRKYDAVVDCMMTSPDLATLLVMAASNAPYRIGLRAPDADAAYSLPVPRRESAEHFVDKLAALLTAFGLQPSAQDPRPRIRITAAEAEHGERVWRGETDDRPATGKRLLVNVASGRGRQVWPDDRFIAVINAARSAAPKTDVIVISAPADRGRAARIAAESGARMYADAGIRDAMSVVASADVVFTPDSSIAHACSAFGNPAVVLHPVGTAREWGPYETDGRTVDSLTASIGGITAEEASRALASRLA